MRRPALVLAALVLAACGDTTPPDQQVTTGADRTDELSTFSLVVALSAPTTTEIPTTTTTHPPSTTTTEPPPPPSTPAPPRTVEPASRPTECLGWLEAIAAVFPADQVGTACRVMACETGGTGDPTIHNQSSSASGLFQFLDSTWSSTTGLAPPAAAHPASVQIRAAHTLWSSSGWAPWSCA